MWSNWQVPVFCVKVLYYVNNKLLLSLLKKSKQIIKNRHMDPQAKVDRMDFP